MERYATVLAGLVLAACTGGGIRGERDPAARHLLLALQPAASGRVESFPTGAVDLESLLGVDGVVVTSQGWRAPELPTAAPALATLRTYVERGGRVLLLGYAAALCRPLGVEPRAPDVVEPFRWGFDDRTVLGSAQLGFQLVSGRDPDLAAGMTAAAGTEHGYFLCGGAPLIAPLCVFAASPPERGEMLGRLLRQRDGATEAVRAAVLTRWRHGAGEVLACGLDPEFASGAAELAPNAAAFLAAAGQWLGGGTAAPRLLCWRLPAPAAAPLPAALPSLAERSVPGQRLLAHWGMVAAVHDGGARTPEQLLDDVLLPLSGAGADLLSLDLVDPELGLPLPWAETDPLRTPKGYVGSAFARGWTEGALADLVAAAHARGMLVQALLEPPPGGSAAPERLATLRFLARQWADRRRAPDGALDGIALRPWFRDHRGLAVAMLQDFQPGGHVVRLGESVPTLAGAAAALDARDGRPAGARAAGFAGTFRAGFPGDLYPVGYLDCAARRLPVAPGAADQVGGGGSFGDWIAAQATAFVRDRRDRGGTMLWRAHAPQQLDRENLAYVHGVSAEPLVAAVAARCTSTGIDGWRDAQRALLEQPPADFGRELPVPAATVMLTNNHFRLLGSGGPLHVDAGGLGRFDAGAAVFGDSFFRTRFFGGRPDADELRTQVLDLLAGGRRGDGGHSKVFTGGPGGAVPTALAFGAAPRWPQRFELPLGSDLGQYELSIEARALAGRGVLAIGVDDAVQAMLPFEDGRLTIARTLPLHFARAGQRTLRLEVLDGGAVAIDRLVVTRIGDVAAEADVVLPAGSLAIVRERSASTYHAETVELSTLADFPGLLLRAQCERAVRGLQQERRFGLRLHRTLQVCGAGEDERELRQPFVLAADDPAVPDLAVVPLQLARYEYFKLADGELVLRNLVEPGTTSLCGFAFAPHGTGKNLLPQLAEQFRAIDRPLPLGLGEQGLAELRSDLDVAWTRVVALSMPRPTPFLVRENGWWTWRGTQPGREDGQALLRVAQLPGDAVQIVGGPSLLARTRPGPGAVHTVALRDPTATSVTARVLQVSPLATPSVILGDDFDAAFLDDRPWAFTAGRTVFLPARVGTYRITVRRHDGERTPAVISSRAVFEHCAFDAATRELVLAVAPAPDRPPELPFTAVLSGPRPQSIDGGEIVEEKELRHRGAEERAAAERGGTVIRFRPGLVRIRYGQ